ncbi:endo-1,4-beta-xylanase [Roseateles sp. LYH14W]|uniref:Beta-xylanase n=1 Tax=Pelomonas parva TaxID=3299032 RepID=A0ABW7EYM9_9BURK
MDMRSSRRNFVVSSGLTAALAGQVKFMALAAAAERTGLKEAYRDRFLIGAAINTSIASGKHPDITEIIQRDFSSVTPENSMKWGSVRAADGGWKWEEADHFMNFAAQHNLHAVGHTLAWHGQTPDSVFKNAKGDYIKPAELTKKMEEHITTIVGRYKGKLHAWDAVNEAVGDDNQMRKSHYFNILGEQFIDKAFHLAHEVDPKAHLMYNDYNIERGGKREACAELLKRLKKRGVPVQGIGIQAHVAVDGPSISDIEKSIVAYADLGLRVHFTELDVDVLPQVWNLPVAEISTRFEYKPERDPFKSGLTKEANDKLSSRYEELFKLFIKHKDKIDRVTLWGVSDDASWLNDFPIRGRTAYPLLFDRKRQPKDAYRRVLAL